MLKKIIAAILIYSFCIIAINAQKTFWQVDANTIDFVSGNPGVKINLNNGNELIVYTSSSEKLQPALNIENILELFFKEITPLKDSINTTISYNIKYTLTESGSSGVTIRKTPESNTILGATNGNPYQVKVPGDSVFIYLFGKNYKEYKTTLLFKINNYESLRHIDKKALSDSLQNLYNRIKEYETAHPKWKTPNRNYYRYYFVERKHRKNGENKTILQPYYKGSDFVSRSVAANIQNYKNYFTPSFTLSVDVHAKSLFNNKAYATISLYGQYMFAFEKDATGKSKAYRNSFIGLSYEYQNENKSGNVNFYAPFSLAYLVRRKGDFFDKHTFNLGIGGIKYGALTIKSSMYFHDFFKNVTPSVQLAVSIGR